MFKCLFVVLYLFFFSGFCVLLVNASPHRPAPIPYTYNLPCKVLVATRVELSIPMGTYHVATQNS